MRLRIGRLLAALLIVLYPLGAGTLLLTQDGWSVNRLNVHIWYQVTGALGMSGRISPEQFADVANVVLFIPFFAALAILIPTWWWVLLGAALSAAVEIYQSTLGGARISSAMDILTNTLGAVIGVAVGRAVHRALAARDARAKGVSPAGAADPPAAAAPAATAPTTPGAAPRRSAGGPGGSPDDRG